MCVNSACNPARRPPSAVAAHRLARGYAQTFLARLPLRGSDSVYSGGGSKTSLTGKKSMFGKSPKVGELGEILPGEEERAATPTIRVRKSNGLGIVTAAATVAVGAVAALSKHRHHHYKA